MFWGVKLEEGKTYSQLVEKSFHISHAALTSCSIVEEEKVVIELHAIVENTDYILCHLGCINKQLLVQQPLDLNISEGEEIVFYLIITYCGNDPGIGVYLTGYFTSEDPEVPFDLEHLLGDEDEDLEDDEVADDDSETDGEALWTTLMMNESLSDTDSDEDYTIGDDKQGAHLPIKGKPIIEEIAENIPGQSVDSGRDTDKVGLKKRKREKHTESKDNDNSEVSQSSKSTEVEATPKAKRRKKMDGERKKQTEAAEKETTVKDDSVEKVKQKKKKEKAGSLSFVTSGGTEVQELQTGTGKVAKNGKKVFVKYTGRLAHNQKIIDSNLASKKPFMFRLGQREVIAGWDEGIAGMKVGGKRKLFIPPAQGYGSGGSPPKIPPNSKLIFDVELIDVK